MNEGFQNIILWEDTATRRLGGVALLRPVWTLRSGTGILRERALSDFSGKIHRWVRPHLVEWQRTFHPETIVNEPLNDMALLVNGRVWDAKLLANLPNDREWIVTTDEGAEQTVIAAFL